MKAPVQRSLSAIVVIVLTISLYGQVATPAPADAQTDPKTLCVVAGRVVTAVEGAPLASARVALVPERPKFDTNPYVVNSTSDGRFLIKDVPPGRYSFVAIRAGFVDQHYQSHGNDEGAVLSLTPGQKIDDVLFRMTRAAVITGRVNNDLGEPLVGVQVLALRRPTEDEMDDEGKDAPKQDLRPVATAHTDDRGQYRIFGLKPGEYYLQVSDDVDPEMGMLGGQDYWIQTKLGSEYASVYYPGVGQAGQAEVIALRAGDEVEADVSLRHIKTAMVAGHVVGPTGPGKHAYVSLEPVDDEGFSSHYQDSTDDKGAFEVKGVPPGSYVLQVYQDAMESNVYEMTARQKIEVEGEDIPAVDIVLGRGTTFEGRVIVSGPGAPTLERIRVAVAGLEDNGWNVQTLVKKDGTFEFASVNDGSYRLNVWGLEKGWFVKSVRLGMNDVLENGLQVEKGAVSGRLEIVISSACAQLDGAVVDDGKPLVGARVHIVPDPETPYNRYRSDSAMTDQTGHFSFSCLRPGKYRVTGKTPLSAEGESYKSEAQSIALSEGEHQALELKIVRPPSE